ncbi:ABC transporter permease [Paenibacillus nasutitermitis]|uniref:Sugar ABC transporter permease n=1 Tax=Paenibacillus nasutitermitis TaxID=1652958 RepID=A0A917DMD0_9BACL|nr:ABC transporter permease subunit [Paenibacillus nasutitermitis]GGD49257.1 sugar ABC transporter permease [Paenibacillus nasutitermitis]
MKNSTYLVPLLEKKSSPFRNLRRSMKVNWPLYLLLLPPLLYFLVFCYWPMYGVQIAFKDFWASKGIVGSEWVGFIHFENFFNSIFFERTVVNTILISVYSIVLGFPAPIIFALLINELISKRFQKIIQNVSYAPYFISQVVMVGIIFIFLAPDKGLVNNFIGLFGFEPIAFMNNPGMFKSIYVLSGIWQSTGWSAIIFIAVLAGIDHEQIEAAVIDGANKWQRIWHISLPYLMPTAVILFILSAGNVMSVGFEKIFLMQNSVNMATSDVISTYVYRLGLQNMEYSFSTAVGLFNSVINFVILIVVNAIAKRTSEVSLW